MKITVNRADLDSGVTWAKAGIGRRPPVPVLAGMMLTVADGQLTVSGFDLDTAAIATVPGDDAAAGRILVHGAALADAVKTMPKAKGARVALTVTRGPAPVIDPAAHEYSETETPRPGAVNVDCGCGWTCIYVHDGPAAHAGHIAEISAAPPGTLTVACDGVTSQLTEMPADDYPALPELPEHAGTFDADAFAPAFTRVAASAGSDDTLPSLTCVQVSLTADGVAFAATDRYRLATDTAHWTPARLDMPATEILLPARPAVQFLKAAKGAGKIGLHYDPTDRPANERGNGGTCGHVALVTDQRTLITRANDGQFPRIERLFSGHKPALTVTAGARALQSAVDRAGKQTARNGALELVISAGSVTVHGMRDGAHSSAETVPCETDGPDLTARFNPAYLASILAGVTADARLTFDGDKPARVADPAGDYLALICPIRIPK